MLQSIYFSLHVMAVNEQKILLIKEVHKLLGQYYNEKLA
jgi:hypothetical protein